MGTFYGTSQCVLHIGMHRTGTTLLQEFMYLRKSAAAKEKIKFIEIDECRNQGFLAGVTYFRGMDTGTRLHPEKSLKEKLEHYTSNGWRLVLSEENISGSMEDCVLQRTLYPNVSSQIKRLGSSIDLFDTVYISIRSEDEWWLSCLAFLRQRGFKAANYAELATSVVNSKRTWVNVIDEVAAIFPDAKIVVREFNYHIANPKRQLKDVTAWPQIKSIRNIPTKKSNGSSNGKQMLLEGIQNLFTAQQVEILRSRYARDLELIAQNLKGYGVGKLLID